MMNWFVGLGLGLMVLSGMSVLAEWSDCSEDGGRMVQGLDWNGYVCVDEK